MRPKKFPERVEKFGVVATIYKPKKTAKGFTIAYYVRGELERKTRNSYEDAKQLALSVLEQKGNGELDVLTLNSQDCLLYRRAVAAVKPTGRPLDMAAHDYAEAVKLLGPDSLIEAVKFYLANRTQKLVSRTVEEVVTELLENKRTNGRSRLYLIDLRLRLTRFSILSVACAWASKLGSMAVGNSQDGGIRGAMSMRWDFPDSLGRNRLSPAGGGLTLAQCKFFSS